MTRPTERTRAVRGLGARTTPIVFLDFDDVICVNKPYGGYDVVAPDPPDEMWQLLFHVPAVQVLRAIVDEFSPRIVITTSWLRFLDREGLERLFCKTGLQFVVKHLHTAWDAPQNARTTRLSAIEGWLTTNHRGENFVVLDDVGSGTGLRGSSFDRQGRVVLCDVAVGLHLGHLPRVRDALTK